MVNVFIWYPSRSGVGHAAMSLKGMRQAYISWWPNQHSIRAGLSSACKMHQNIDEDVVGEDNKKPSETYLFNGLNEQKIYDRWLAWKQSCNYRIVDRQCCTTVGTMLEAGSGWKGEIAGQMTALEMFPGGIWTPCTVAVYCRELRAMNF